MRLHEASSSAAAGAVICLRDIHRRYTMGPTEVSALRGITMDIAAGEFVAITGASGSGKSSLINIIGCLDSPSSGQYLLGGLPVSALDRKSLAQIRNRKLGFVFQNFNLIPRTTALENVALPLLYSDVNRSETEKRAQEALTMVGLSGRAEHWPSQLSGGQQQRVAIARALVNRPEILLADESTGSLDSATSAEIMELFQRLNNAGLTIIMVTHEAEIAAYAMRTVSLRDGRIQQDVDHPMFTRFVSDQRPLRKAL